MEASKGTCIIPGCSRPRYGHGWCSMHWKRWWRNGDPNIRVRVRGESLREYLWHYSTPHIDGACWIWSGPQHAQGYGVLPASQRRAAGTSVAHRAMWEQFNGPIPDGLEVCHDCPDGDNPACVNPSHLYLGTHRENMADMSRKGRASRGHKHPHAKLTEELVRQLRADFDTGMSTKALAKKYNITPQHALLVGKRRVWKHITEVAVNP